MDWKLFSTTFLTIFLAEMGDKTQFAALAASSRSRATVSVWLGVVLGLAVAGTVGVFAGRLVGEAIPPHVLRWLSGSLFVAVGVWVLVYG